MKEIEVKALKKKQAAARYNMDPRTFDKWVNEYDLPHIKLGRTTLFPIESLDEAFKKLAET